jgi:hypothetical protein
LARTTDTERLGQLGKVLHRIVRLGRHPEVVAAEAAFLVERKRAQGVMPDQGEQTEVHIADPGPFQVMKTVTFIKREEIPQPSHPVVGVGVLEQQLHRDTDREGLRDGHRQSQDQQGDRTRGQLDPAMHRMLHQSVEAVEPFDAVVYRV